MDELQAAWRHCRKPSWPETFDEAMQDALLSRLVRITAMHPPRGHRKQHPVYAAGSSKFPALPRGRYRTGAIDGKRAAAGDRDDD